MLGIEKFGAWAGLGNSDSVEKSPLTSTDEETAPDAMGQQGLPVLPLREEWTPGIRDLNALRHFLTDSETDGCDALNFANAPVTGLSEHSTKLAEGNVFFAVPGRKVDGADFAEQARARGACAIVAARRIKLPLPVFIVKDVRRTAGRVAAAYYGDPSKQLPVVGVTGTNGKTTVTDLLSVCLEDDCRQVGSLGTIQYRLGPVTPAAYEATIAPDEKILESSHTTPGPIEIQAYLREMLERGVRAAVIEVSSHALDQGRTDALHFTAAVFTNLSQDHLDYHGNMAAYQQAKLRLFQNLEPGTLAVLPEDEPSARAFFDAVPDGVRVVTYGFAKRRQRSQLHVRGRILAADLRSMKLEIDTPDGCIPFRLPLVGMHNARNALAAITCAIALDVGALRATDALSRAVPVEGRLTRCEGRFARFSGRELPFSIFIDYAHTPDALRCVLEALLPMTKGKLRVLFGCGGDRDKGKRPVMGRIAIELGDHVVLSNDNPRSEDARQILEDIQRGVDDAMAAAEDGEAGEGVRKTRVDLCPDRGKAIRHLLEVAEPGDTLLIAGKGHEKGQIIGDRVLPFCDRSVVEDWLCSN